MEHWLARGLGYRGGLGKPLAGHFSYCNKHDLDPGVLNISLGFLQA